MSPTNINISNGLTACKGLLSHKLYRASAVLADFVIQTGPDPSVCKEFETIKGLAEKADEIARVHDDFFRRSISAADTSIVHRVFSPLESRSRSAYFEMDFHKEVVDPFLSRYLRGAKHINAIFEQVHNMRLHGGGGIFEAFIGELNGEKAVTSITMDLGPGLQDFGESLIASIQAHEQTSFWGVPGCVTGLGSFNIFDGSHEMLIESRGFSWTKERGPVSMLKFGKGNVTAGTCARLRFYI